MSLSVEEDVGSANWITGRSSTGWGSTGWGSTGWGSTGRGDKRELQEKINKIKALFIKHSFKLSAIVDEIKENVELKNTLKEVLKDPDLCTELKNSIPLFKNTAERGCVHLVDFLKKWIPKAENVSM
jgi:hypothetical protein